MNSESILLITQIVSWCITGGLVLLVIDLTLRVKDLLNTIPDPVYQCELYLSDGCAHVDGFLCDYPNCQMLKNWNLENHG